MDEVTIRHLREAVNMCGYDFDDILSRHTNRQIYTDMRAIVWAILQEETGEGCLAIGRRFGWNRSTVFCSIKKALDLRDYDRDIRGLYDSVYGYYMNFESIGNERDGLEGDSYQGAGGPVDGEA